MNYYLLFNKKEIKKLIKYLEENKFDDNLIENIEQIINFILFGEKKNSYLIDLFIENNVLDKISLAFEMSKNDYIKYLIISKFYLLILNLKSEELLNYIITNKIINKILIYDWDLNIDEINIFVINFCKSLSNKFGQYPIGIWYNKNNQEFPLLYQTFRYYNSNDSLTNTTLLNIICNILKNKKSLSFILKSYPFNKIFIFIIFKINYNWEQLNKFDNIQKVKYTFLDLNDILDIFLEIMNINFKNFNNFFNKIIFSFIILKPCISSILKNNNKFFHNSISYLLIFNIVLKFNSELINLIFDLFFKKNIPKEIHLYLKEDYKTLLNFNNIDKGSNLFDNNNRYNKNQLNYLYDEFNNIKNNRNNNIFKSFFKNIFDNIYNKNFLAEIIIYEKITGENLYKNALNIDWIKIFQNSNDNLVDNEFLLKNWIILDKGNERIILLNLGILNNLINKYENFNEENKNLYEIKKYQDIWIDVC